MNLGFEIVLVTKVAVIWTSFSSRPDDDDVIILVVTFFLSCVRAFVLLRRAFVLFSQEFATLNYLGF